jgi:enolase
MDAACLARRNGWEIDPCSSRGDPSADLAVSLNCGDARADLNRLLEIEEELGGSGRFLGEASYERLP